MSPAEMSRRKFIGSTLLILLSETVGATLCSEKTFLSMIKNLAKPLHDKNLLKMGELYRKEYNFDPGSNSLFMQISVDGSALVSTVLERIASKVKSDFLEDRTWSYDGWLFSRTEIEFLLAIQQCADS